jgi:hypothetical protein
MRNHALAAVLESFLVQAKELKLAAVLSFKGTPYMPLIAAKIAALDQITVGLQAMLAGESSKAARAGLDALIAALDDIAVKGPQHLRNLVFAERAGTIETKLRLLEVDEINATVPDSVVFMDSAEPSGKNYRN